ncbi:MAG: formimidoylglutamate deiminase [Rhodobacteraceae bacterium]|nr:formimidoylglutamate deiminase [Paracoccaceae bacterium]
MTRLWAEQALLQDGWARDVALTLNGDRIGAIETGVAARPGDRRLGALLPAPANLHSHAFQRAMAGMTERRGPDASDSFWTWRQLMFRFLDQLTPEDVEAIAAFVQMEMLEAGYGSSVEFHYLHNAPGGTPYADPAEMSARIVAGAARSGIGLTLLPVLYMQGGCDRRPLGPGQVRFGTTLDGYARLLEGAEKALAALPPDAVTGVAPHSLRAVTHEALAAAVSLRPDAPLHLHLAEQVAEVEEVLAAYGSRPVEWLLAHAEVGPRWCLIHATQMLRAETLTLAATGAVAGLCPITESSLGDGIFDGVAWTAAGGRFGIGSDSNIRIGLTEELRVLEHSQRLRDRGRAMLATPSASTGRILFEGAARGGAQAAGRAAGAIAEGLLADLVALDTDRLDLEGRRGDALLDAWIFAGDDRAVSDVWSAGRHLVTDGHHVAREAIVAAYRAVVRRLKAA